MEIQKEINSKESDVLEAWSYLRQTDYLIVRSIEGYSIDDDVLTKREEARNKIRGAKVEVGALIEENKIEDAKAHWMEGEDVTVGDKRWYKKIEYIVTKEHTTQSNWNPERATTLWEVYEKPSNEMPRWKQPTGAHNAYAKDATVLYNGKEYKSIINANTYAPDVYGWELVN